MTRKMKIKGFKKMIKKNYKKRSRKTRSGKTRGGMNGNDTPPRAFNNGQPIGVDIDPLLNMTADLRPDAAAEEITEEERAAKAVEAEKERLRLLAEAEQQRLADLHQEEKRQQLERLLRSDSGGALIKKPKISVKTNPIVSIEKPVESTIGKTLKYITPIAHVEEVSTVAEPIIAHVESVLVPAADVAEDVAMVAGKRKRKRRTNKKRTNKRRTNKKSRKDKRRINKRRTNKRGGEIPLDFNPNFDKADPYTDREYKP